MKYLLPVITLFVIFALLIALIYYARSCYKYRREINKDEDEKDIIVHNL